MDSQYLLDKCREPCLQKLNCKDICLGTCGECKQGRIHVPCSEICNKINPCNHTYVLTFVFKTNVYFATMYMINNN